MTLEARAVSVRGPHTKLPQILSFLGPEKKPLGRSWEIFHRCLHWDTDSSQLLHKWSELVYDTWLKGHVVLVAKNTDHVTELFAGTPWAISPIFGGNIP